MYLFIWVVFNININNKSYLWDLFKVFVLIFWFWNLICFFDVILMVVLVGDWVLFVGWVIVLGVL